VGGFHGNLTNLTGWVGSAERDIMPKLNLWYEFSNCCCHADRSISHLSFTKNEYRTTVLILTEIVEDIVEVSDNSHSSIMYVSHMCEAKSAVRNVCNSVRFTSRTMR